MLSSKWLKIYPGQNCGGQLLNMCEQASKFYIPWITPSWNASTWSPRWGQLIWMTLLDCRGLLWPGTTNWPLHKNHSGYTEVLTIFKFWNGFKISPILADLWQILSLLREVAHFKPAWCCVPDFVIVVSYVWDSFFPFS